MQFKQALVGVLLTVFTFNVNAEHVQLLRGSEIVKNFHNFASLDPTGTAEYVAMAKDALEATDLMLEVMDKVEGKVKSAVGLETMEDAYRQFKEQLDLIRQVSGDKAEVALREQAAALANIVIVQQDLAGMAMQLKDGAEVLLTILMNGETDTPEEELSYLFNAQREVLLELLEQTSDECDKAKISLENHAKKLADIKAQMEYLVMIVEEESREGSNFLRNKENKLRTDAYAGCVASVLGGPAAVAACYSIAAGVIEGKTIPDLKKSLKDQQAKLDALKCTFQDLATSTEEGSTFALKERQRVITFKSKIASQKNLIKSLPYSSYDSFKSLMTKSLEKLIDACDEYLDIPL